MSDKRKVTIKVIQSDLLLDHCELLAEGAAQYQKNQSLTYQELAAPYYQVEVEVTNNGLRLHRHAENPSTLEYINKGIGSIVIDTEYGSLELANYTNFLQIQDQAWIVEYDVKNGEEVVGRFRTEWQIKEDQA